MACELVFLNISFSLTIVFQYFTSIRSEYGAFYKCVAASGTYALTQLGKMLLLATFFPTAGDYNEDDPEGFSPVRLVSSCCFYTV